MCRFTLTRGAILFVGGVIVQLDYNCLRTGEGSWIYILTLLFDWFRVIVLPNRIRKGGKKYMKTENLIRESLKGLLTTAIEKVCVLGEEDAQEDLKRLREVYEDLVLFWGLDEDLIDEFDEKVGILK